MKNLLLASAAVALISSPAMAQTATDGEDQRLPDCCAHDRIIVLGEGLSDTPATPAFSNVEITRDQIVESGSGRLEDVLKNVAGFQQFRRSDSRHANPSAQGATLRALGGNASSRALVLLDGVPMGDPFFGYIPFSAVDPTRLGSVQVTRGGGSGPFGAGALAGTIEMESAGADQLGLFTGQALVNHRGDTQASASIAPEIGNGFATVSGSWDRGDGFFTTPEDQRVPISSRANYDAWSVSGRLVQEVGNFEVQLRGAAFEDNRTLRFVGADNSISGEDFSLRVVSRGPWEVDILAYAQWRNFTNEVISSTRFVRVLDQKDTPAEGQGGKIEVRPPVGENMTLRLGADYRRAEGNLFEDSYNAFTGALNENRFAGGVNSNVGLFAENDLELGALTLTGGVRADRYSIRDGYYRAFDGTGTLVRDDSAVILDRSDWEVTWRAGAMVQANEAVTLRAAAYTSIRVPTLNELYRGFTIFPVRTDANAALEPERMEGWEVGADFNVDDDTRFSITVFDNSVENAIANVTLDPAACRAVPEGSRPFAGQCDRQRQNLDAIEAFGVEVSTNIRRGPWGFDASLALSDTQVRGSTFPQSDLDGNRPPHTPTFSASATASYHGDNGVSVSATLRHVSDQFETDSETGLLPAATTVDLFASVPLVDQLAAVARVENLFDAAVVTRNQSGSIDLGIPQTIWVGLRYGF